MAEALLDVEIFETGIKVIDLLAPYARAARSASSAAPASARPSSSRSSSTTSPRQHGGVLRVRGVGERTREGNDLWLDDEAASVADGDRPRHRQAPRWSTAR
jgi:F-type H+-transporting ATPase subunit beta